MKKIAFIIIVVSLFIYSCSKDVDMQKINEDLKNLPNLTEKINYMEKIKNKNHDINFRLANYYINDSKLDLAINLLYKDVKASSNYLDKYESMSLYCAINYDLKQNISIKDIEKFNTYYSKMTKYINSKLKKYNKKYPKLNLLTQPKLNLESAFSKDDFNDEKIKKEILEIRKLKLFSFDPYNYNRIIGDYLYTNNKKEMAFINYDIHHENINKPLSYYTIDSMKNYIKLLLEKKDFEKALEYQLYLINLKPNMYGEILRLASMYKELEENEISLITLLFLHTNMENSNDNRIKEIPGMIKNILDELKSSDNYKLYENLVNVYFSGNNIKNLEIIIDKIENTGITHFYFSYLKGLFYYINKDYKLALGELEYFDNKYLYSAESAFYQLSSIYLQNNHLDEAERVNELANKIVKIKPKSDFAIYAKILVGNSLNISKEESINLLFESEILNIIDNIENNAGNINEFKKVLNLLSIRKNVYQTLAINLFGSRIKERKNDLIRFINESYNDVNELCQNNLDKLSLKIGFKINK